MPTPNIYTGIGSRLTPEVILALMRQAATALCLRNWTLRSGGADGADHAFYAGAVAAANFDFRRAQIYLAWNGMKGHGGQRLWRDPRMGLFDAQEFESWEAAYLIARRIHGGFDNMGTGGRALHTRNVFQILGHDLKTPTRFVLFYAKPVGNTGQVKGGTNTAIKLALEHEIPRINLYTPEGQERLHDFLKAA